jgi:hypothetical protein
MSRRVSVLNVLRALLRFDCVDNGVVVVTCPRDCRRMLVVLLGRMCVRARKVNCHVTTRYSSTTHLTGTQAVLRALPHVFESVLPCDTVNVQCSSIYIMYLLRGCRRRLLCTCMNFLLFFHIHINVRTCVSVTGATQLLKNTYAVNYICYEQVAVD